MVCMAFNTPRLVVQWFSVLVNQYVCFIVYYLVDLLFCILCAALWLFLNVLCKYVNWSGSVLVE